MRRQYPKPELMKTMLCEQVRPELNKKLTFIGVYAGDQIVFHPEVPGQLPFRTPALAFVFIFKDGVGEFETKFSLLDPAGQLMFESSTEPTKLEKGRTGANIIQIQNVVFESEGSYTAIIRLERKKYEFQFIVTSNTAASGIAA